MAEPPLLTEEEILFGTPTPAPTPRLSAYLVLATLALRAATPPLLRRRVHGAGTIAVIVEVPNPGHPYGVRGAGEVPIVAPLAAVANALHYATGKRFRDLPINPGRILQALHGVE